MIEWLKQLWFRLTNAPKPKPQKRICALCQQAIKRNHKWFYFEDGTRHKDCANPVLEPIPPQIPLATGKDSQA